MSDVSRNEPAPASPNLAPSNEVKRVDDVRIGAVDGAGRPIDNVYFKFPEYAIYRSQGRILIQFADDAALADRQIERASELLPLRDQVEFLTLNLSLPDSFYTRAANALRLGIEGSIDACDASRSE